MREPTFTFGDVPHVLEGPSCSRPLGLHLGCRAFLEFGVWLLLQHPVHLRYIFCAVNYHGCIVLVRREDDNVSIIPETLDEPTSLLLVACIIT